VLPVVLPVVALPCRTSTVLLLLGAVIPGSTPALFPSGTTTLQAVDGPPSPPDPGSAQDRLSKSTVLGSTKKDRVDKASTPPR